MVPEYTGSILSSTSTSRRRPPRLTPFTRLSQQKLPTTLAVLNFAQAEDKDTITVTQDTAKKYNLRTLADLCPVAGPDDAGCAEAVRDPASTVSRPSRASTASTSRPSAARRRWPCHCALPSRMAQIDAADLFSTDPAIQVNNFVSSTDSRNQFRGAEHRAPRDEGEDHPDDRVCGSTRFRPSWTQPRWPVSSPRCRNDKQDPESVAKAWLVAERPRLDT